MKRLSIHPTQASRAFTLVEIMIVVAIIALLCAIAIPNMLRARKRSQAVSVLTDLRLIDAAMDQYAIENVKPALSTIPVAAWKQYIKPGSRLYSYGTSVFGDVYGNQVSEVLPSVPSTDWDFLSDVVTSSFWSPYSKGP